MDWDKASAELKKKLDPAHVKPAKSFGPKGDYVEGWFAIQEANRIFGFGEWSYTLVACACVSERPREIGKSKAPGFGVTYTATVRVEVGGVVREDVGAGHGYDVDCGLAHESAIKEAVTDALKRSLRSFGNPFGLALYDKTRENVGVDAPAFDAKEVKTRTMNAIIACTSIKQLGDTWKGMAKDLGDLKRHDEADFAEVERVKNKMKQELETAA